MSTNESVLLDADDIERRTQRLRDMHADPLISAEDTMGYCEQDVIVGGLWRGERRSLLEQEGQR
jgi:hypothetical protein